jgi:hypothetical protein
MKRHDDVNSESLSVTLLRLQHLSVGGDSSDVEKEEKKNWFQRLRDFFVGTKHPAAERTSEEHPAVERTSEEHPAAERTSEEHPAAERQNTLDGVKYRLIMKKVLEFERFWIYRIDDLVDSRTKRGDMYKNLKDKDYGIHDMLLWFGIKQGQDPWLWPKIRTNVQDSMERIKQIKAEIETLDFEQFKTTPPTYYPFYSEFSVQNIIDAQKTILTELTTWLDDPWGKEGPEKPRGYKVLLREDANNGSMQDITIYELREYERGYDNDTENADVYQEWVNGNPKRTLTEDQVRDKYPNVHLGVKVGGVGTLLSALVKYAE